MLLLQSRSSVYGGGGGGGLQGVMQQAVGANRAQADFYFCLFVDESIPRSKRL